MNENKQNASEIDNMFWTFQLHIHMFLYVRLSSCFIRWLHIASF